jgi:hypothetical protein
MGILYIFHTDGQLGIGGIRLMTRMTSHIDDSMICFNVVLNVS